MSNSNESEKWRKFLQPVITGLVAMMTAVVGYLQYLQKQESEQAFGIVSIDSVNKVIYCTRIGAGSDRQISYS